MPKPMQKIVAVLRTLGIVLWSKKHDIVQHLATELVIAFFVQVHLRWIELFHTSLANQVEAVAAIVGIALLMVYLWKHAASALHTPLRDTFLPSTGVTESGTRLVRRHSLHIVCFLIFAAAMIGFNYAALHLSKAVALMHPDGSKTLACPANPSVPAVTSAPLSSAFLSHAPVTNKIAKLHRATHKSAITHRLHHRNSGRRNRRLSSRPDRTRKPTRKPKRSGSNIMWRFIPQTSGHLIIYECPLLSC